MNHGRLARHESLIAKGPDPQENTDRAASYVLPAQSIESRYDSMKHFEYTTGFAMKQSRSIHEDFIVMSPDKRTSIEPCDEGLYQRLDADYNGFAGHELVSCHTFSEDWSSWEVHPKGDEIVMLLSGSVTFILEMDDGERSVELTTQGAYAIVPRGVWHTATVSEAATVLFITPGEGTQHRDA